MMAKMTNGDSTSNISSNGISSRRRRLPPQTPRTASSTPELPVRPSRTVRQTHLKGAQNLNQKYLSSSGNDDGAENNHNASVSSPIPLCSMMCAVTKISSKSKTSATLATTRTKHIIKLIVSLGVLYSVSTSWTLFQWTANRKDADTNYNKSANYEYGNDNAFTTVRGGRGGDSDARHNECSDFLHQDSLVSIGSLDTSSLSSSLLPSQEIIQDNPKIQLLEMQFVDHYAHRRRGQHYQQLQNKNTSTSATVSSHTQQQQEQQRPYRILCTSTRIRLPWGSYKLRCQDLQRYADQCVDPNTKNQALEIVTGIPIEFLDTMWNTPEEQWPNVTNFKYPSPPFSSSNVIDEEIERENDDNSRNENVHRIDEPLSSSPLFWNVQYDATIFVKSMSKYDHRQYGRRFIDLVDEYNWQAHDVPQHKYELILQTPWQGLVLFPRHKSTVVEHWFNSYPLDMIMTSIVNGTGTETRKNTQNIPLGMPIIRSKDSPIINGGVSEGATVHTDISRSTQRHVVRFATVWNTRRTADPYEGGCPILDDNLMQGGSNDIKVTYDCLDLDFDITSWYPDRMASSRMITTSEELGTFSMPLSAINTFAQLIDSFISWFRSKKEKEKRRKIRLQQHAKCEMQQALADPLLGTGKLYYNIFQQYDVLVVPVKNHTMKLHFGNVQRAVSQMRSGVPVLLEIRGKVLQDFMDRYNYTCAFTREVRNRQTHQYIYSDPSNSRDTMLNREQQQQQEDEPYDNLESELNSFLDELADTSKQQEQQAGSALSISVPGGSTTSTIDSPDDLHNSFSEREDEPELDEKLGRRRLQSAVGMSGSSLRRSSVPRKWNHNNNSNNNKNDNDVTRGNGKRKHGRKGRRQLWTFSEAVIKMTDPEVRYQCQQQGLQIAQDYSPSKIGQKFLRAVGYEGDFVC